MSATPESVSRHAGRPRSCAAALPAAPARFLLLVVAAVLLAPAVAAERYALQDQGSYLLVVTGKAGLFGALGHEHAVLGEALRGTVCYDPARPAATRGEISVDTASLVIDSAEARRRAELGEGPKPEDVEEIQARMLSGEFLAADQHPAIRFALTSVRIGREGPLQLSGDLTLRGTTRSVTFPASIERGDGGTVRVAGSFTIEQSAFGIEPASVGGVVKVADPVEVRVHLDLAPTGQPCGSDSDV